MKRSIARRSLLVLSMAMIPTARAWAAPTSKADEDALYQSLLDLSALTRTGTSYNEYNTRLANIVVLLDRSQRNGGGDPNLEAAVKAFREAASIWWQAIEEDSAAQAEPEPTLRPLKQKLAQSSWRLRDLAFDRAYSQLAKYAELKAAAEADAASAAATSKAKPAVKRATKKASATGG
jgi:hypothetical protein